jgi:hypothetical protein
MPEPTMNSAPELSIRKEPDGGSTRVDLLLDKKSVSRLWLTPFTIHVGRALIRMDGVGGVGTSEAYRSRGYSRRVLEAAVKHMENGDAAISMLYGIRDVYPKFGYATVGPDHVVVLTDLDRDSSLPTGWSVRPFAEDDMPAAQELYAAAVSRSTGAAVREHSGSVWTSLRKTATGTEDDECRVVVDPRGVVRGYLWRARWCWYVKHKLETDFKKALVIGEVMADSPVAADAVLAAARLWALEEAKARKVTEVVLAFDPEGALAAAAMRQDARFLREFSACGGSMARTLDVRRLLEALQPELMARLQAARCDFVGSLTIKTDIGAAALRIDPKSATVTDATPRRGRSLTVALPQTELVRLALGAFPPDDVLARLPEPPGAETAELLQALFPLRCPHMHLPDRY